MHQTKIHFEDALEHLLAAPRCHGMVDALFARPVADARRVLERATLRVGAGMEGDRWWHERPSTPDPVHENSEVALIGSRVAGLLAGHRERWELFGDQIFLDLDLSEQNLPAGQTLRVGEALLAITSDPHLGCGKFAARFGVEALKFVNRKDLRHLRLRGVFARVLEPGDVLVGSSVLRL